MTPNGISPASSGPAGSLFEGQAGAFYLFSLLTGMEPRGLPGTMINLVAFQRAPEGRPLDDVIVQAHDVRGTCAVLEIQVFQTLWRCDSLVSSDRHYGPRHRLNHLGMLPRALVLRFSGCACGVTE